MNPNPILLKAIDPADLIIQVKENLEQGRDLYTPLFVSHEGLLCQRVVPSLCVYEYQLIIANDLDSLELQERNFTEMGFDYMFNTVMWNAKYLQWMCRLNNAGLTVRDAVAKFHTDEAVAVYESAERKDELQLVEDVRAGLRLAPLVDGALFVGVPFPVMGS